MSRAIVAGLMLAFTLHAHDHASRAQTSSLPSGSLTLGVVTAEFRPDGTFVAEASIQDMGALRATAQWKAERDIVELVGWNASKGLWSSVARGRRLT